MSFTLHSLRNVPARSAIKAAALAAFTLVNPAKLRGAKLGAYTVAGAGLAAWQAWDEIGHPDVVESGLGFETPAARVGVAVGVAGLTAAVTPAAIRWDASCMALAKKLHLPSPRLLAAVVVAAGCVVSDATRTRNDLFDNEDDDAEIEPGDLDPGVRAIAELILSATDDWGAPTLRQQLSTARQYGETDDSGAAIWVDDDAPRTELDYYEFPFVAHWDVAGRTGRIGLEIVGGHLDLVVNMADDGEDAVWPDLADLTVGPVAD